MREYCEYCDIKECCEIDPNNCKLAKRIKESKDLEQAVGTAKKALLSLFERFVNWLEGKLQKKGGER